MKLTSLLSAADMDTLPILNYREVNLSGICPDSRRIKNGELYVALDGFTSDGHEYVADAEKNGAAAALVSEKAVKCGRLDGIYLPLIVCDDTRSCMARLYAAFFGQPQKRLKIVGVTGTNGKTSTATLIYEILRSSGRACGLIGTLGCFFPSGRHETRGHDENASMTTPDPEELYGIMRDMADEGAEYLVMEVSSHALALSKVEPIDFEVAVFTNLTPEHLDMHGNMEEYFRAKSLLFKKCRRAVINYDDKYGRILADQIKSEGYEGISSRDGIMLCSMEGRECDTLCADVHLRGKGGIEYKLISRNMRLRISSPMAGDFNVMNTAEAALACYALGVSPKDIKDTVAHFSGARGRLERINTGRECDFSVYIDYAHTPDALENLIRCVKGFAERNQRIVVLFGCGGDRDKYKRPMMGRIAVGMADFVIITSDNSRSERAEDIISDILSDVGSCDGLGAHYTVIKDRREAIRYAIKTAKRGDIILLCGKGHEAYEIDSQGKRYFSEREEVYAALRERNG